MYPIRASSLEERKIFYKNLNLNKIKEWIKDKYTKFGVIIGRQSKISPINYEYDKFNLIVIEEYNNLKDIQNLILEYLPESVYYDRNIYDENNKVLGQELAFDLDLDLISDIDKAKSIIFLFYNKLSESYSNTKLVYSGRGFHFHIFDEDTYFLTHKERSKIIKKYSEYKIDYWVTDGRYRHIRLPFSLNGMISRIVTPININDLNDFNLNNRLIIPNFIDESI